MFLQAGFQVVRDSGVMLSVVLFGNENINVMKLFCFHGLPGRSGSARFLHFDSVRLRALRALRRDRLRQERSECRSLEVAGVEPASHEV